METQIAKCSKCDFQEEYEQDPTGMNYYQAVGKCPKCDAPTVKADGRPTREFIVFVAKQRETVADPVNGGEMEIIIGDNFSMILYQTDDNNGE